MGLQIKLLVILSVLLVSEKCCSHPTTANPNSEPKGKGILEDIFEQEVHEDPKHDDKSKDNDKDHDKDNEHKDVPEMGHLMSNLVSLLPDDMEQNLRKEGFNVFLDNDKESETEQNTQPKKPPSHGAIHGGVKNPSLPKESSGHFIHHLPPQTKQPTKEIFMSEPTGIKPSNSARMLPSKKNRIEEQPYFIAMTVEEPIFHFSSTPVRPPTNSRVKSKSQYSQRSKSTPALPQVDEISTLEIQSKALLTAMKFHPPPEPKPRKVSRPIIIVLDDDDNEDDEPPKKEHRKGKNSQKNNEPDLSSLFRVLSMLEKNQGSPVSVLPSSKTKQLEDSVHCIRCSDDPSNHKKMFDFDVLPQLILSDSGVNAMGTSFDIVGNRLVKRETSSEKVVEN